MNGEVGDIVEIHLLDLSGIFHRFECACAHAFHIETLKARASAPARIEVFKRNCGRNAANALRQPLLCVKVSASAG